MIQIFTLKLTKNIEIKLEKYILIHYINTL